MITHWIKAKEYPRYQATGDDFRLEVRYLVGTRREWRTADGILHVSSVETPSLTRAGLAFILGNWKEEYPEPAAAALARAQNLLRAHAIKLEGLPPETLVYQPDGSYWHHQ